MLKVGFFVPSGKLGGAEQLVKELIIGYTKNNNIPYVFFLTNNNVELFLDGIDIDKSQVYISPFKRESFGYLYLPFVCLFHTIKFGKLDFVFSTHVHLNSLVGLFRRFRIIYSKVQISRESTLIFKRFSGFRLLLFKLFYKIGYRFIPIILCQTRLMRSELIKNLPWLLDYSKILVLNNPINLDLVKNKSVIEFNKPDFDYIVSAGSLTYNKGFDILIKSFKNISIEFPNIKLLILGEGEYRSELEKLVIDLNLENRILLLGWQKNVYPYFVNAKACIVSSRIEGFPNVLLQKMACCNTIVSTLCADGIDQIPGLFTCQINDSDILERKILKALSTDNANNRLLFDNYLKRNTIDNYIAQLNEIVDEQTR